MAIKPDWTLGTLTLTAGSAAFTTTGSALKSADIQGGDTLITQSGLVLVIATITGENSGTLYMPCPSVAAGFDQPLRVRYQADGSRLPAATRHLINELSSGNLFAFSQLQGGIDKVPYFIAPGVLDLIDLSSLGGGGTGSGSWNALVGTLAGRDAYNDEAANFRVLIAGNGKGQAVIYQKTGTGAADWSMPIPFTGAKGNDGHPNKLEVGSVVEGEEARVTITGTPPNQTVNFVLRRGAIGPMGDVTPEALAAKKAAEAAAEQTAADVKATGKDVEATAADRIAISKDADATALDVVATGKDAAATALDRVATGKDAAATALDVVATGKDAAATALDRVATGKDATATAADVVSTGKDAVATALDRVATGKDADATTLDVISTGKDATATALDRVATGKDATATALDVVATGKDAAATALDRIATGKDADATAVDVVATGKDAAATALDRVATGKDAAATALDVVATGKDATAVSQAKEEVIRSTTKAQEWANAPEGQEVNPGEFSARHWAKQAEHSAGGGVQSVNNKTDAHIMLDAADVGAAPVEHSHADATPAAAGFMSAADKVKLEAIPSNADKTNTTSVGAALAAPTPATELVDGDKVGGVGAGGAVLKTWSWATIKAGIKLFTDTLYASKGQGAKADTALQTLLEGSNISIAGSGSSRTISARGVQSVNNKTDAAITLTASDVGAAPVDHSHADATPAAAGFMSAADKVKLEAIPSNADKTNTTSVGAALAAPTPATGLADGDKFGGIFAGGATLAIWSWATVKAAIKLFTDTLYATKSQGDKADTAVQPATMSSALGGKQDKLNFTPVNKAGDTGLAGFSAAVTPTSGNIVLSSTSPQNVFDHTNVGAMTITAPSTAGAADSFMIFLTNTASAGSVAFLGFPVNAVKGDTIAATSGKVYCITVGHVGANAAAFVSELN